MFATGVHVGASFQRKTQFAFNEDILDRTSVKLIPPFSMIFIKEITFILDLDANIKFKIIFSIFYNNILVQLIL